MRVQNVRQATKRAIALNSPFRYVRQKAYYWGSIMADHTPAGPVELGADMDYAEHQQTYNMFLHLVKYGSLVCIAILIVMAAHFFAGFGLFSSLILFILICGVGVVLLR
jgi:hypothetical protein